MPLKFRILLFIAVVNVGVLLLVTWVGIETAGTQLKPQVLSEAMQALQAVGEAAFVRKVESSRYLEVAMRRNRRARRFDFASSLPQAERRVLEQEELPEIKGRLEDEWQRKEPVFRYDGDKLSLTVIDPAERARWAVAYVGFTQAARQEALAPLRRTFLILCIGTAVLILSTFLMLNRVLFRPLAGMAGAVRAVSEGQTPPRVKVSGRGEFARLSEDFSAMAREVHEYQTRLEERVRDALQRARAAENRLVVAQRLASTGTLAAGFAHEINNPLGGVLNAVNKLSKGGLPDDRRVEYFELVLDGLDRIGTIVQRMLHFTPRAGDPAAVDLGDVADQAIALARHRAETRDPEVAVRHERGGGPAVVSGDAQELAQAALNLVLNAIDAVPEKRAGEVVVGTRAEGEDVILSVGDDGIGMDEETRQRCVDLFYSSKPEGQGTGLGLAIVQHIVTDHGGGLEIESAPDKGTTIVIRLPMLGGV